MTWVSRNGIPIIRSLKARDLSMANAAERLSGRRLQMKIFHAKARRGRIFSICWFCIFRASPL